MEIKGASLASRLNNLIDKATGDRGSVIAKMGASAGISPGTVNQILNASINCPPIARLEGFAKTLGVSLQSLRSAAEKDGCKYDAKGYAVACQIKSDKAKIGRFAISLELCNKLLG